LFFSQSEHVAAARPGCAADLRQQPDVALLDAVDVLGVLIAASAQRPQVDSSSLWPAEALCHDVAM